MLIVKPSHNKYAFRNLDDESYASLAKSYSKCKRYGFRDVAAFCTGTGTVGVIRDMMKGTFIQYGKRRFAAVVLATGAYTCAPAMAVMSNATKVVRMCKVVYTTTAYIFEAAEDVGTMILLPIDFALFGQPIPTGESKRFRSWDELEDIVQNIPIVGD